MFRTYYEPFLFFTLSMQISTFIGSKKSLAFWLGGSAAVVALLMFTIGGNAERLAAEDSPAVVQEADPVPQHANVSVTRNGPVSVLRGTNLTDMLTVHNDGPSQADNVVLGVTIPGDLTYLSASGGGCAPDADRSQVSCSLGTIGSSQTRTVSLTFKAKTIANCQQTQIDNSAYVNTDTEDADSSDDLVQQSVTLECPAQPAPQASSSSSAVFVAPPPVQDDSDTTIANDGFNVDTYQPQTGTDSSTQQVPNVGLPAVQSNSSSSVKSQQKTTVPTVSQPQQNVTVSAASSSVPSAAGEIVVNTAPTDGQVVFSAPGMTCRLVQSVLHCDMSTPDFSQGGTSMQRSFQSPQPTTY